MILGTGEMRAAKLSNKQLKITVDGKEVLESNIEKLLGLVVNNTLTWKNHIYGDHDNIGLLPQLSKRLGMLRKLSKFMSKEKLSYFSSGIFYSKLSYCLPVFVNIFGLDTYKEENRRYFSFTVKDNNNLQVLQNKLNKLLLMLSTTPQLLSFCSKLGPYLYTRWLHTRQLSPPIRLSS